MRTRETIVALVGIIVFGILAYSYLNRNRPHVPTTEEAFVTECAERGGDAEINRDWGETESLRQFNCKEAQ